MFILAFNFKQWTGDGTGDSIDFNRLDYNSDFNIHQKKPKTNPKQTNHQSCLFLLFVLNFFTALFRKGCCPFTFFIVVGWSQYWWKCWSLAKHGRIEQFCLLYSVKDFFITKSSHMSFSSSSSTNRLSFVCLPLCNLPDSCCVPTPLPPFLQTFHWGSSTSMHVSIAFFCSDTLPLIHFN